MIIGRLSILNFEISGSARDVTALFLIKTDLIKIEYRFLHRYITERTERLGIKLNSPRWLPKAGELQGARDAIHYQTPPFFDYQRQPLNSSSPMIRIVFPAGVPRLDLLLVRTTFFLTLAAFTLTLSL